MGFKLTRINMFPSSPLVEGIWGVGTIASIASGNLANLTPKASIFTVDALPPTAKYFPCFAVAIAWAAARVKGGV